MRLPNGNVSGTLPRSTPSVPNNCAVMFAGVKDALINAMRVSVWPNSVKPVLTEMCGRIRVVGIGGGSVVGGGMGRGAGAGAPSTPVKV